MCVAVNSHACYKGIVNGITNCSTCLKKKKIYFGIVCVKCVCVSERERECVFRRLHCNEMF